jgi:hypothetical protein
MISKTGQDLCDKTPCKALPSKIREDCSALASLSCMLLFRNGNGGDAGSWIYVRKVKVWFHNMECAIKVCSDLTSSSNQVWGGLTCLCIVVLLLL